MIVVSVCLPSDALPSAPTVLLGFLLPWTWGMSSRLLQKSTAAAPDLGLGVAPLGCSCHLVKAMVFPVVMYGCESWTIKLSKEELMLLNCGVGEDY